MGQGGQGGQREAELRAARSATGTDYAPLRYLAPHEFDTALKEGDVQLRQLWKESPWTDE